MRTRDTLEAVELAHSIGAKCIRHACHGFLFRMPDGSTMLIGAALAGPAFQAVRRKLLRFKRKIA